MAIVHRKFVRDLAQLGDYTNFVRSDTVYGQAWGLYQIYPAGHNTRAEMQVDMPCIYSGAKTKTNRKVSCQYGTHFINYVIITPPF